MPISLEIQRRVNKKMETNPQWEERGEEGVFHVVPLDDDRYYVKQWYKMHEKAKGVPAEKTEASPCSPYWTKVKYHEYGLIHDAFPDHTIQLVGAYDERIRKEGERNTDGRQEYTFGMFTGRPATISLEVTGDPILAAKRNEAMAVLYAPLFEFTARSLRELRSTVDDPFYARWRENADRVLQGILGKDIHLPPPTPGRTATSKEGMQRMIAADIQRKAKDFRKVHPNSIIVKMMQCGVVPTHPELNFIPAAPGSKPQPPHGTFIELAIRDLDRFVDIRRRELANDPEVLKRFNSKLERYRLYRLLDEVFDNLSLFANYGPKDIWKFEPEVETAFFRLTEAIREMHDRRGIDLDEASLSQLYDEIKDLFRRAFFPGHLAALIEGEIVKPMREIISGQEIE